MSTNTVTNQNITNSNDEFLVSLESPLCVAEYSEAKKLPESYLRGTWGVTECADGILMPYRNPDGSLFREKLRRYLRRNDAKAMMEWRGASPTDQKTIPYGLDLIPKNTTEFFLVEGESDTQTAQHSGYRAVGISGANGWRDEFASLPAFADARFIFVVQEPGEAGEQFVAKLARSPIREKCRVVTLPAKDFSELYLRTPHKGEFAGIIYKAKDESKPIPLPVAMKNDGAEVGDSTKVEHYATTLGNYLNDAGIKAKREDSQGGYKWILEHCPFNREHAGTSAALFVGADGKLGFKCQHKSCAEKNWQLFKAYLADRLGKPLVFDKSRSEPAEAPQSEIKEDEIEPEIVDEPLPEFPAITGSIQELAEALCPDIPREFKIMAAVTRVGLAVSGKVQLEGELHLQPRFYTCFIAEAGRGKTAAIKETRVISSGYREVPSVDSAPALVDAFAEFEDSPRCLLLSPDEAVDLFEKGKTSRDSRNSLFSELLKLFEDNRTGNRARRNESPIEIHDAHLAILCGATLSGYDGMWMGSRGASGGLQSRFIPIVTTALPIPAKQRPSDTQRVHAAVERMRQQIESCNPTLIRMTADAEETFKAWWKSVPKDKPSTVRVEAIVKRFLLVLAVTSDTDVIGSGLMTTGIAFGEYIITVRDRFNPADAYSWVQAFERKIEKCYERQGVPMTRDRCRKLVHPDRCPGGYGDFIRAYGNLVQAGRLTVQGKSERAPKFGLDG